MRRRMVSALLALTTLLSFWLPYGALATETGTAFPGEVSDVAAEDTTYEMNSTALTLTDEDGASVTQLQGNRGSAGDLKVDATSGKFAPRESEKDVQVNAGTILYVPVAANENGATVTVSLSGGSATFEVDGTAYGGGDAIAVAASESAQWCVIEVTGQTAYLSQIDVIYADAEVEFPGDLDGVAAENITYVMNSAALTLTDEEGATVTKFEGNRGSAGALKVDATNGKFAPRDGDVQVNAGTILYVPVAENITGATVTVTLSGNSGAFEVKGTAYAGGDAIPVTGSEAPQWCVIEVTEQAYISQITVTYGDGFPGEVSEVAAEDTTYVMNKTALTLTDEEGATVTQFEGSRGSAGDLKIDAISGKFAPRDGDVQVNAGAVIYVPVAANEGGATVTVSLSGNSATFAVDGMAYGEGEAIPMAASDSAQWCAIEVMTQAYISQITVTYEGNFPGEVGEVAAEDTNWNLAAGTAVLPNVQSGRGSYEGLQIDATSGKFAPRDSGDTQVTGGTVIYVPVAPDAEGINITVSGNNYNNLTVTWNGESLTVGTETSFTAPDEASYIALTFAGEGSCYLTGITLDYLSDNSYGETVVTVNADGTGDYTTIQAALDANTSTAKDRLVLSIAPGSYEEQVTVSDPYVTFTNSDPDSGEVIIHAAYYSSNTRDEDGNFVPQDEYDLGTSDCGTVIVASTAIGFTAEYITFQNDYNITEHTESGSQTPAVALNTRADKVTLNNCKIIGRQDTLYVQGSGSRVTATDCYIEGTVDFIFGDADALFTNCTLYMACFAGRESSNGYFTAPNTDMDNVGLVFYQCTLKVDDAYTDDATISLGRAWQTECYTVMEYQDGESVMVEYDPTQKSESYADRGSAAQFIGCTMADEIKADRWSEWTRKYNGESVSVTYAADVRFAEVNSKDSSGNLLAVPETVTLGTFTILEDSELETYLNQVLGNMNHTHSYGEPTWTWAEDYSSATARFTCQSCLTVYTPETTVTSELDEAGNTVYTATVTVNGVTYTDTQTAAPAHTHTYGEPVWTWAEDYSTATAAFTCTGCDDVQTVEATVTNEITGATCTEAGQTVYTATATFAESEYTDSKTVEMAATGHSYGEPAWTWAEDYSTATAAFTCTGCDDVQTVEATVTSETDEDGNTVYTATATFAESEYTDTQTVVPAHTHTYGEPVWTWAEDYSAATAAFTCTGCDDVQTVEATVTAETTDATCTEAGQTVYTATATFAEGEYTDSKTVEIAATGHSYGEAVWTWAEDYSAATATFTCAACDDVQTVEATVTNEITGATCAEDGGTTYTATAVFQGETVVDVKSEVVPAFGHSYGEATWTWAEDNNTAVAILTCSVCGHVQSVGATVIVKTTEATCTEAGETVYTATATVQGETVSTTKTIVLPATGHTYVDGKCTACGEEEPDQFTGMQQGSDGIWRYVVEDEVNTTYTGLVAYDGDLWYVEEGVWNSSYTSLCKYDGVWYYVGSGKVNLAYTGLTKYNNSWWYVKDGVLDRTYTGLVKYNNSWWYVKNGVLDRSYTGLVKYNNSWWYVASGRLDRSYTGLVKYNNSWWYVDSGRLDRSYTGLVKYNNSWWYVDSGRLDRSYTGLAKYNHRWWYVKSGRLDRSYNGTLKDSDGKSHRIRNGMSTDKY